jgi:hypothetical protein
MAEKDAEIWTLSFFALSYKQLEVMTNQTSFYVEKVTDITTRN